MSDVTVITPTRPGREALLMEAVDCVQAQTSPPAAHFIGLDADAVGPALMRNALLSAVQTELVAFLDDDDLLDTDHIERLVGAINEPKHRADLAWSYHRTQGRGAPTTPRPRNDRDMRNYMKAGRNVIPVTVVARLAALNAAGGFQAEDRYEDYSLWCRLLDLGYRFTCVPVETWTYRFLGENRTWQ